uniref:Ig-like domain-containing protein n=1 Tax=Monopterus albus TaxID=43700 RepID=A0A3Q3JWG6_MONAL
MRFFVLLGTGLTVVSGPDVVKVVVKEGEDAILPCCLYDKEDIEFKLFDWKKDGQKEVFLYDAGLIYNNGHTGQDDQFKQRVSYFPDQLTVGNASIVIKQTKVTDSGNYTCDFPRLQSPRRFHIELVVGAARKPYVTRVSDTKDNAVLQCEVQGAFPKPQLQWQDRGRYDVILNTTVTKTDHYRCVVTQEEISHEVYSEIDVNISGSGYHTLVVVVLCVVVVLGVALYIFWYKKRGRRQKNQDVSEP